MPVTNLTETWVIKAPATGSPTLVLQLPSDPVDDADAAPFQIVAADGTILFSVLADGSIGALTIEDLTIVDDLIVGGDATVTGAVQGATVVGTTSVTSPTVSASTAQRLTGANGQVLAIQSLTELTTILAAAETDTTIEIPAGAIVIAVSTRVTTVIPTAATFDVGIAGALTRYGTGIAVAANTTDAGTDDGLRYYAAATKIRITPDVQPAAATGRVRVTIYYILVTPPTS